MGLRKPRLYLPCASAYWLARAITAAHMGAAAEVPPTSMKGLFEEQPDALMVQ